MQEITKLLWIYLWGTWYLRVAMAVLILAVAFRVSMPAWVDYQCINSKALSNACLLAGSMRE